MKIRVIIGKDLFRKLAYENKGWKVAWAGEGQICMQKEYSQDDQLNTYYYLQYDSYGQPNGHVKEIRLTESDFKLLSKDNGHLYDSYMKAQARAQN